MKLIAINLIRARVDENVFKNKFIHSKKRHKKLQPPTVHLGKTQVRKYLCDIFAWVFGIW